MAEPGCGQPGGSYPTDCELTEALRERARQLKDWTAADSAREELLRKGVTIHDTASGPVWERSDDDGV